MLVEGLLSTGPTPSSFLIVANLLDELALHALRILDVPVGEMG